MNFLPKSSHPSIYLSVPEDFLYTGFYIGFARYNYIAEVVIHMGNARFVNTTNLEFLLKHVVLDREIFIPNQPLEFWKCAYNSVEAINKVLGTHLKEWKGSDVEKTLKKLKKRTNRFIKQIKKSGTDHGAWVGASPECCQLLKSYRSDCIPLILDLVQELSVSDETRLQVEAKLAGF